MTDPLDDLDAALLRQFKGATDPEDAGFSLRVMAALPAQRAPGHRRRSRWIARARWTASTFAACGLAALLSGDDGRLDLPHALAAAALTGLLIFWSVPSRWSRG